MNGSWKGRKEVGSGEEWESVISELTDRGRVGVREDSRWQWWGDVCNKMGSREEFLLWREGDWIRHIYWGDNVSPWVKEISFTRREGRRSQGQNLRKLLHLGSRRGDGAWGYMRVRKERGSEWDRKVLGERHESSLVQRKKVEGREE